MAASLATASGIMPTVAASLGGGVGARGLSARARPLLAGGALVRQGVPSLRSESRRLTQVAVVRSAARCKATPWSRAVACLREAPRAAAAGRRRLHSPACSVCAASCAARELG